VFSKKLLDNSGLLPPFLACLLALEDQWPILPHVMSCCCCFTLVALDASKPC
jgi:hypothetical protein